MGVSSASGLGWSWGLYSMTIYRQRRLSEGEGTPVQYSWKEEEVLLSLVFCMVTIVALGSLLVVLLSVVVMTGWFFKN